MRRSQFEEQIIGVLRDHDAGVKTVDLCRRQTSAAGQHQLRQQIFARLAHPRGASSIAFAVAARNQGNHDC